MQGRLGVGWGGTGGGEWGWIRLLDSYPELSGWGNSMRRADARSQLSARELDLLNAKLIVNVSWI